MDRLMKYNEVKGIRFTLTEENLEDEIDLKECYEYVKIEDLRGVNNVAIYINNAAEEDYVLLKDTIEFQDISIKKIKVKLLREVSGQYIVQAILMR